MPENDLFPASHYRYCHGSRIIHQHFILLHPDAKHFLTVTKEYRKTGEPASDRIQPEPRSTSLQYSDNRLNLSVLLLSVSGVAWIRSYYTEIISTLFPQLETESLLPCWITGSVLFLVVSLLNVMMIHKKLRAFGKEERHKPT